MTNTDMLLLELIGAVYGLAAATYYLTWAVSTLAVVGLVGYWVALRAARPQR